MGEIRFVRTVQVLDALTATLDFTVRVLRRNRADHPDKILFVFLHRTEIIQFIYQFFVRTYFATITYNLILNTEGPNLTSQLFYDFSIIKRKYKTVIGSFAVKLR